MERRTHRSFVSYIDKSREYYAAQGYEQPYRWVAHDEVAFTSPSKPLGESTIGVVTTSYLQRPPKGEVKQAYAAAIDAPDGPMFTHDLSWAKDETHTDDLGSYLPIAHLQALAAAGVIGSVAPRFYGVPTAYSSRRTQVQDGPQVAEWAAEDGVDLLLLVPL